MFFCRRRCLLLLGALVLIGGAALRLVFISTTAVIDDEAYYYVWSNHLAGGYVDGGPTIAYINKLFVMVFGANSMSVRLGAVVMTSLLALYLWRWGARRFGAAPGFFLLLLVSATPVCFACSVIHTYDTEMTVFMLAAVALYYDAFFIDERRFYAAGIALGLALLSKVSVLFPALGIIAAPLLVKGLRGALRKKEFYLSFLIAGLIFSPFLCWNLTNDFAFIRFKGAMAFRRGDFGDFLPVWGAQVGLFMPILFWFAIVLPFRTVIGRHRRDAAPEETYFALIGVIPLIYFCIGSFFSRYYSNWLAPAFFGGMFLTSLHFGRRWGQHHALAAAQVASSAAVLLMVISQIYLGFLPLPVKSDPTNRYFTYSSVLSELKDYLHVHPEFDATRVVADNYQVPSMVNLYLQPRVEAVGLSLAGYHKTEYSILYPPNTLAKENFLFLAPGEVLPARLRDYFATVEKKRAFISRRNGRELGRFTLWYVTDYNGQV
jgi:4-amino-4-deoxy-L-arabinose transferase-like glycosyltransferase